MKTNKTESSQANRTPRPVRHARIQASSSWLPLPVSWPSRPGAKAPQQIKIRQTPPWSGPSLSLI